MWTPVLLEEKVNPELCAVLLEALIIPLFKKWTAVSMIVVSRTKYGRTLLMLFPTFEMLISI
jgi:hypothetical protein